MDAAELSSRLGISAMAVRQRMPCKAERLVTYQKKLATWVALLNFGSSQAVVCSDGYAELTLSFIQSVVEAFGEAGLERLLEIRARQQIETYGNEGQESIEQRLQILAEIRPMKDTWRKCSRKRMGHSCWQKITVPFVRLRLPNTGTLQ